MVIILKRVNSEIGIILIQTRINAFSVNDVFNFLQKVIISFLPKLGINHHHDGHSQYDGRDNKRPILSVYANEAYKQSGNYHRDRHNNQLSYFQTKVESK